jgi:DNA-binding protein HU-beta
MQSTIVNANRQSSIVDSSIFNLHSAIFNRFSVDLRDGASYNETHPLRRFAPGGLMNKQELIAKIAQDTGMTKTNAAAAVDSFFEGITKSLKKGHPITFVGFGTFKTAQRKARTARNPQTGAAIKVPKRRVVRFSAGKALKTALN